MFIADKLGVSQPTATAHLTITGLAPSHTMGVAAVVPAGTIVVALDQVPGAVAFYCYPEEYKEPEAELVPVSARARNYSSYSLWFAASEIGDLLEPLEPLLPRPPNRLPQ